MFVGVTLSTRLLCLRHVPKPGRFKNPSHLSQFHKSILFRQYSVSSEVQSVLLPGKERIRASKLIDDPTKFLVDIPNSSAKTVYELLDYGQKHSGDGNCAGARCKETGKLQWMKYSEFITRTQFVGSALINAGLRPCPESFVGIFSSNRIEFMLTLYGCAGYSMVLVPLYATLGIGAVHYIVNQALLELVICDTNKNALTLLEHISEIPSLKTVIIIDKPTAETIASAEKSKIKLQTFAKFEADGKRNKKDLVSEWLLDEATHLLPKPEDLFCIPYTSGTTGVPKGVMMTHKSMISCVSCLFVGYGPAGTFGGSIVSYLPPAHIYEIANEVASIYFGRGVAFFDEDIKNLLGFIREVKPTIVPLVPRLMNVIYSRVIDELKSSTFKWYIKDFALSRKEKLLKKGIVTNKTIWDKLLFKNFYNYLGGNAHLVTTTSAPVASEVLRFFRCASGCYVFEVYGQTEQLGSIMNLPCDTTPGGVGVPLPSNHVKLVDVPEMGYFSKDDVGEICVKGANVFQGYFKNQKATDESIDKDGWQHSGDIGKWLPNGTLKIIDRKKHLFKLSQGEYIAPEKVEIVYGQCKLVLQVYVDGITTENYVVAIVFPEPGAFSQWTNKKRFPKKPHTELLVDKDVRKEFLKELQECGRKAQLNSFEQAKNLHLIAEPFSVENELLTPTMKLKRNQARKHLESEIINMYKEGPLIESLKT